MRLYDQQPAGTVTRARDLRRNAAEAETRLWRALREAFPNARFRRQVPIGPYFADFLGICPRLIVEVDGGQHAVASGYDAARTRFLETQGYRVLRFWNNDVLANTDGVIAHISFSLGEKEGAPKARKDEGERAQEKGAPA
jgi:very-short-patch-repair endonuclease